MLAGSKQRLLACYQGIIFFMPFFFLLVDSSLESAAGSFAGAALSGAASPLPAGVPVEFAELDDTGGVVPSGAGADVAVAAAGVVPAALAAGVVATAAFASGTGVTGAGLTVVPGALVSGETAAGGCGGVAGCESGPVLIISTPTPVCCASAPAGTVLASSGVTTSVLVSAPPEFAAPAATVNDGPCAPGRSTSVADTTSFGGFS